MSLTRADWPKPIADFYTRATTYRLHTNVRKHRIVPDWDPACKLCPDGAPRYARTPLRSYYTQSAQQQRPSPSTLLQLLSRVCATNWLPDQDILLPGLGHEDAQATTMPRRPLWKPNTTASGPTKPSTALRAVHTYGPNPYHPMGPCHNWSLGSPMDLQHTRAPRSTRKLRGNHNNAYRNYGEHCSHGGSCELALQTTLLWLC